MQRICKEVQRMTSEAGRGKRGADGRAASEGEGRGGTTDGDEGEGEETRRAWLILHQTCPLFSSVCPSSSPPTPYLAIFRQKL